MIEDWVCPKCGGWRFHPKERIVVQVKWSGGRFVLREPDDGWEWFKGKLLCSDCLVPAEAIEVKNG